MYLLEALKLNAALLEIVCTAAIIFAASREKSDEKKKLPIGSIILIVLFRYLLPALWESALQSPVDIGARFGSALVFYILARQVS